MCAKYIRHSHTLGGDMLFTSDPCYGNSLLANVFWSEYSILLVLCIAPFCFINCLNPPRHTVRVHPRAEPGNRRTRVDPREED